MSSTALTQARTAYLDALADAAANELATYLRDRKGLDIAVAHVSPDLNDGTVDVTGVELVDGTQLDYDDLLDRGIDRLPATDDDREEAWNWFSSLSEWAAIPTLSNYEDLFVPATGRRAIRDALAGLRDAIDDATNNDAASLTELTDAITALARSIHAPTLNGDIRALALNDALMDWPSDIDRSCPECWGNGGFDGDGEPTEHWDPEDDGSACENCEGSGIEPDDDAVTAGTLDLFTARWEKANAAFRGHHTDGGPAPTALDDGLLGAVKDAVDVRAEALRFDVVPSRILLDEDYLPLVSALPLGVGPAPGDPWRDPHRPGLGELAAHLVQGGMAPATATATVDRLEPVCDVLAKRAELVSADPESYTSEDAGRVARATTDVVKAAARADVDALNDSIGRLTARTGVAARDAAFIGSVVMAVRAPGTASTVSPSLFRAAAGYVPLHIADECDECGADLTAAAGVISIAHDLSCSCHPANVADSPTATCGHCGELIRADSAAPGSDAWVGCDTGGYLCPIDDPHGRDGLGDPDRTWHRPPARVLVGTMEAVVIDRPVYASRLADLVRDACHVDADSFVVRTRLDGERNGSLMLCAFKGDGEWMFRSDFHSDSPQVALPSGAKGWDDSATWLREEDREATVLFRLGRPPGDHHWLLATAGSADEQGEEPDDRVGDFGPCAGGCGRSGGECDCPPPKPCDHCHVEFDVHADADRSGRGHELGCPLHLGIINGVVAEVAAVIGDRVGPERAGRVMRAIAAHEVEVYGTFVQPVLDGLLGWSGPITSVRSDPLAASFSTSLLGRGVQHVAATSAVMSCWDWLVEPMLEQVGVWVAPMVEVTMPDAQVRREAIEVVKRTRGCNAQQAGRILHGPDTRELGPLVTAAVGPVTGASVVRILEGLLPDGAYAREVGNRLTVEDRTSGVRIDIRAGGSDADWSTADVTNAADGTVAAVSTGLRADGGMHPVKAARRVVALLRAG